MNLSSGTSTLKIAFCVVFCGLICCPLSAQDAGKANPADKSQKTPSTKDSQEKPAAPPMATERRAELLAFVKSHHPEIRPLLNSLRSTRPANYQAAMTTLDREVRQLQVLEKRDPVRFETSLEEWIVKSKIKLIAAQLSIKKTPEEKAQLNQDLVHLIAQQQDLRIELTIYDLVQTGKKMERLATHLGNLRTNRDADIERQQGIIQRNAQRVLNAQKKAAAAKKKNAKPPKKTETNPAKDK